MEEDGNEARDRTNELHGEGAAREKEKKKKNPHQIPKRHAWGKG